ncbi:MAG TPA: hypothetical protein GXZ87_08490 [Bacteroidales bacterium]|nr:hypothetical protein [Bacteroidales bacterium]
MSKTNIWFITAKTNLHVGDENSSSYGLIDKTVQRDALTGLPCIHSSSLKGALNEYCSYGDNGKELLMSDKRITIFGSDKTNTAQDTQKGSHIFFDAHLLFLPQQDDSTLYKLVSCKKVIDKFVTAARMHGIVISADKVKELFKIKNDDNILTESEFKDFCSDENLPIIARNVLENGESKNLWYEQVLPAETVFYAIIQGDGDDLKEVLDKEIVQIGANATIGYGYCEFNILEL